MHQGGHMKVLKRAEQRNVIIDLAYYDLADIKRIMNTYHTFFFAKDEYGREKMYYYFSEFEKRNTSMWLPDSNIQLRLFLDDVNELKVVNLDGYYHCVAVTKDGEMIHVEL